MQLVDATERKPRHNTVLNRLYKYATAENVAEELPEEDPDSDILDRKRIGALVVQEFEIDQRSNKEWRETAEKFMDVALQVRKAKSFPFPNASNVKYPLITVAALQFNARAYPAIFNEGRIVKAKVVGDDNGVPVGQDESGQPIYEEGKEPGAKQAKADRISEHMSYQLTEEMDDWEEDMDTMLMRIPIVGCDFKKVYRDGDQNASDLIPGTDVFVNRKTKSLRKAPRITHRVWFYPHEIEERKRDGRWLDEDLKLSTPVTAEGDVDAPHEFLEQHRRLDLDGDKYGEPYIVTVHKDSAKVVRIVANYAPEDVKDNTKKVQRIKPREYFVKFGFLPDPNGGFYDIGFGQLLESINASIDTVLNQMIDAGTLQNAGGGFIGSGVRLKRNQLTLEPGVYKTVDASGSTLRDAIVNLEHSGPSAVLFNLLGMLIEAARDITGVKDILTGDTGDKGVQTATTTLAMIEQGLKTFTAIYQRIYRSLKKEFKLLYGLNAEYLEDTAYFNVMDTPKAVARADYVAGAYDVCPHADPKVVTDLQRAARANVLMQFAGQPGINTEEIYRRVFIATGQEDVDALIAQPAPPSEEEQMAKEAAMKGADSALRKAAAEAEKAEADAATAPAEAEGRLAKVRAEIRAAEAAAGKTEADAADSIVRLAGFMRNGPPGVGGKNRKPALQAAE